MRLLLRLSSALVMTCFLLSGCARTAPEQALRDSVSALQEAVEQRDASAVQDWLAEDFVGPHGMDRDGARRLAALTFLRRRDVGVSLGPLGVSMSTQQDHATVRFTAALTAGAGGALPATARVYDVETGWRNQEGDWRLTSARWTPKL